MPLPELQSAELPVFPPAELPIVHADADSISPIDREQLAAVSGGDEEAEREILADFRATNGQDADALRDALERASIGNVAQLAHSMKGAARTIGAGALAEVCEHLEKAGRDNDWPAIEANREALWRELARLDGYLESFLSQGDPKVLEQ